MVGGRDRDRRKRLAHRYDGTLGDIYALQDQMTISVIGAVQPTLLKICTLRHASWPADMPMPTAITAGSGIAAIRRAVWR
jgi:hypothetical protein